MKEQVAANRPAIIKCLIWGTPIKDRNRRVKVIGLNSRTIGWVDSEAFKTEVVWKFSRGHTKKKPSVFKRFDYRWFDIVDDDEKIFNLVEFMEKASVEVMKRVAEVMGKPVVNAIAEIHAVAREERKIEILRRAGEGHRLQRGRERLN